MIDTNPEKIEEILTRGVESLFPNKEFIKSRLMSGKRLKIYWGIDPTGKTLHIGHAIPLKKLSELQKLGHEVIFLVGNFTAMIGDPTDKLAARKILTAAEVKENMRAYKKQASKFLKFGFGGAKIRYNAKWLSKLSFKQVLELASNITHSQMIKRSMFQERIKSDKEIYLNEFMYPLMQGYDSVVMDVDGEMGGSDQIYNMLMGRDLQKKLKNKEKFVIATKLLEDPNGKKMGKTEGNMVSLSDNADEIFGKVMSWTDGMIIIGFELCTNSSPEDIEKIKKEIEGGTNPRDAKIKLAKGIIEIYHGKAAADKAEENFINTFKKGGLPENIEEIKIETGKILSEVLVEAKMIESKSEFRRLVTEGAVSDAVSGEKITDANYKIEKEITLKIGKKRFVKITL